jgi:hypothetical protein
MPADNDFDRAVAGHRARNDALAELIVKKGGNLDERRNVDLHFWAPDEIAAMALAAAMRDFGATNAIYEPAADGSDWNVEAQYQCTVTDLVSQSTVERLVTIAMEHKATFDGWGTRLSEL